MTKPLWIDKLDYYLNKINKNLMTFLKVMCMKKKNKWDVGSIIFNIIFFNLCNTCNVISMLYCCIILIEDNLLDFSIHWIIYFNYLHLQLALWIACISKWLKKVATIIYFIDFHDVTVSPQINGYLVWNQALRGSRG